MYELLYGINIEEAGTTWLRQWKVTGARPWTVDESKPGARAMLRIPKVVEMLEINAIVSGKLRQKVARRLWAEVLNLTINRLQASR